VGLLVPTIEMTGGSVRCMMAGCIWHGAELVGLWLGGLLLWGYLIFFF
jgi:hypothetical protein